MKIFPDSAFFKERRAPTLPTPAEIRAINEKTGDFFATNSYRPLPVRIPSLQLLVKYGTAVTIVEAESQTMVRDLLGGQVPVPEVFGWTEDSGQKFIYMSLIEGDTLQERWATMNDHERQSVCKELKHLVATYRTLKQDEHDPYVGSLGKQPLNEIFIRDRPGLTGPFQGAHAVKQFQEVCGIEISGKESPITFTHNDLVLPNIMVTSGSNPKVAAIIDWGQAGWYPAYWEYCKAREVMLSPEAVDVATQEEWRTKYLPTILEPVDEEQCYYPWRYFVLSKF